MQRRLKVVLFGILLGSFAGQSVAQELPRDTSVIVGKLPNGFQYFIKENKKPEKRAVMYLVNKVGSILEEEHERGLAHFLEHMNFKGTTHFPKNELIDYLEKAGVKFGADLNAYTSFDETVYQLPIPTNDAELWENGLQIMRDWASEALIDPQEYEKERGVILEEKRLQQNAQGRMRALYMPTLYNYSRYAERLPIGLDKVISGAGVNVIRDFYTRWYRPDLQALIVVGDIDVSQTEQQIKALFADLKSPASKVERPVYPIALIDSLRFVQVKDKEFSSYQIEYIVKRKSEPMTQASALRGSIVQSFLNNLLAVRLQEISRSGSLPYLRMNISAGDFMAGLEMLDVQVSVSPEKWEEGFKAAWSEFVRVQKYGFSDAEFQDVKKRLETHYAMQRQEKDKVESASLVESYMQYFLHGDVYMALEDELDLKIRMLAEISPKDIQDYLNDFASEKDRVFMVMGADKDGVSLPEKSDLLAWIQAIEGTTIHPYVQDRSELALFDQLSPAGKVTKQKQFKEVAVQQWTLSNSVQIYAKQTDFKNDEIIFTAFSKGGSSLYADKDYYSAMNATTFVTSSGVGQLNANQLSQFLNAKAVQVVPYIGEREEGFNGASIGKDLETGLGLVHQYMVASRLDTSRFNVILDRAKTSMRNRVEDPNRAFADTVGNILGAYHYRRQPTTLSTFEQIDSLRVKEIFTDRFSNAGDFSFVFVGNFDLDSLKLLTEKYLGSLPASAQREEAKDLKIRVPEGKIRRDLYVGEGEKGNVQLVFSSKYAYNTKNNLNLDALKVALDLRLIERLRKKESGVYSPAVQISKAKDPLGFYAIVISFGCDPNRKDQLIQAVREEMTSIATSGILSEEFDKFKAEERRSYDLQTKSNNFWLSYIKGQVSRKESLNTFLVYPALLDKVNLKQVNKGIISLLNLENEIIVTLSPAKK